MLDQLNSGLTPKIDGCISGFILNTKNVINPRLKRKHPAFFQLPAHTPFFVLPLFTELSPAGTRYFRLQPIGPEHISVSSWAAYPCLNSKAGLFCDYKSRQESSGPLFSATCALTALLDVFFRCITFPRTNIMLVGIKSVSIFLPNTALIKFEITVCFHILTGGHPTFVP